MSHDTFIMIGLVLNFVSTVVGFLVAIIGFVKLAVNIGARFTTLEVKQDFFHSDMEKIKGKLNVE